MTPPPPSGRRGSFTTAIGLDFIVRPGNEVLLIELQYHFGRLGLMRLYPELSRRHRSITRALRHAFGGSACLPGKVREACANKILVWKLLGDYQPSSFIYQGWGPRVERWLEGLESSHVIVKPPRGGCGRGIRVFPRRQLTPEALGFPAGGVLLLQEYVESRRICDGEGRGRVGCVRHIVHLFGDEGHLGFVHLPPYWRVSPAPFTDSPVREAFTANISSGAYPHPLDESEGAAVRNAAEAILRELLGRFLGAVPASGPSILVTPEGVIEDPARAGGLRTAMTLPLHALLTMGGGSGK